MRKPSASTYPSVKRAPGTAVAMDSCVCTIGYLLPLLTPIVGMGKEGIAITTDRTCTRPFGLGSLAHALRLPIAEDLIQVLGVQYPISPALQVLHCGGVQSLLHPVGQRPKALREQTSQQHHLTFLAPFLVPFLASFLETHSFETGNVRHLSDISREFSLKNENGVKLVG